MWSKNSYTHCALNPFSLHKFSYFISEGNDVCQWRNGETVQGKMVAQESSTFVPSRKSKDGTSCPLVRTIVGELTSPTKKIQQLQGAKTPRLNYILSPFDSKKVGKTLSFCWRQLSSRPAGLSTHRKSSPLHFPRRERESGWNRSASPAFGSLFGCHFGFALPRLLLWRPE